MRARLRVAVLIRHFVSTAGAEKYCVELTRRLARDHEVHVFAQSFGAEQIPGVALHPIRQWLRKPRFINQWLFSLQTRAAVGNRFDIVHSHDMLGHANVYTLHVPCFRTRYKSATGRERLTLWLGTLFSPRLLSYYLIEALQFSSRRRPKRFIAVSDYMRRNIERNYPAARGHIFTAYPGLDNSGLDNGAVDPPSAQQRLECRRGLGLADGDFVCLFVANDFRKKGLGALLEALGRIGGNSTLLVAGGGNPQAYRSRIAQLGLQRRVRFVGVQRDLAPLFTAADVLVHPTWVDTFGMAVLEAMAHGLPVIVSNAQYCGIAEQLSERTALLLADPGDPDEIARRIDSLMQEPALAAALAENGRRFAAESSWERTAEASLEAYRDLAGH